MGNIVGQAGGYIVDFAQFLRAQLGLTKGPSLGYDWLLVLFIIFVITLIGFTFGRSKLLAGILSMYLGVFLENIFPYFRQVKGSFSGRSEAWLHVGIFAAFSILIFLVFNASFLKNKLSFGDSSLLTILIVSLLAVGFLTSVLVSYLGTKNAIFVPAGLSKYFSTEQARFIWSLLPIISMLFAKGRRKYHRREEAD